MRDRRFPETHSVSVGYKPVGAIVYSRGRWIPEVHEGRSRGYHFNSEPTQAKARKVVQDAYIRGLKYEEQVRKSGGMFRIRDRAARRRGAR